MSTAAYRIASLETEPDARRIELVLVADQEQPVVERPQSVIDRVREYMLRNAAESPTEAA